MTLTRALFTTAATLQVPVAIRTLKQLVHTSLTATFALLCTPMTMIRTESPCPYLYTTTYPLLNALQAVST